ncbi:MFS transporter [Frankia sp. CiP3]|uniref:MFS transporter n=1 Tax=Frankia sp. CiP3 TaxID=2880971 RepID=UPI001EF3F467|nr:MFS transporter [Frankia sp. CiP3]
MTDTQEAVPPTAVAQVPRAGRMLALALISVAQLMITLDSTIVSVAMPSAQHSVDLSNAGRQWVLTAYTLSFGSLLLLGGRIGDLIGRKRAMLIGVLGFALSSALGGAAVNATMLILARALQGTFAALIAPSTLSLVAVTFQDARERTKALSIYTATMMTGAALGLVLGGVLTTYLGWRWCLYVNVPVAAAVLLGGMRVVSATPAQPGGKLDVPGAVTAVAGMVALIYALGEAGSHGWSSAIIIGSLAAAVVFLGAFLIIQARSRTPLLPLRVLAKRSSGFSFLSFVISAFCTYGMLLGMTYQFQVVLHYSPLKAGLAFVSYVGTAVVYTTQVSRRLVTRLRPGFAISGGLAIFAVALLWLAQLSPDSSYVDLLPGLVLFGVGVGTVTVPAISAVVAVNETRDQSIVSAIVNTAQQAGASIGAALLNTISIGATSSYLASHRGAPSVGLHAAVHGFAVSSVVSAGVAGVGAVIAAVAIQVDLRPKANAAESPA